MVTLTPDQAWHPKASKEPKADVSILVYVDWKYGQKRAVAYKLGFLVSD